MSDEPRDATCPHCGGDPTSLFHAHHCDGQQGHVEADEPAQSKVVVLRARNCDPETSHASMATLDPEMMNNAADLIVRLHEDHGPMADYLEKERFQARWPRGDDSLYRQARNQARNQGRVRDSGRRERNPQTGREQVVWERCHEAPVEIEKCSACGHVLRRKRSKAS